MIRKDHELEAPTELLEVPTPEDAEGADEVQEVPTQPLPMFELPPQTS